MALVSDNTVQKVMRASKLSINHKLMFILEYQFEFFVISPILAVVTLLVHRLGVDPAM
jgi:hypothetical protein